MNLYVFDFLPTSRDSRIKEGEFTVALSNEDQDIDLDERWRNLLGLSFQEAEELLVASGLGESPKVKWMINISIGRLLQVEVIQLEAMQDAPFIVIKPGHSHLFQFALDRELVDLTSPLVLDPIFMDFSSKRIELALKTVGGKSAPIKRSRKRRKANG